MSARALLSAASFSGRSLLQFSSITNLTARTYVSSVWNISSVITRTRNDSHSSSSMLQCAACHRVQPCRNAWFTRCRLAPKIPPTKPLNFDHSGDGEQSLPALDTERPKLGYDKCDELKDADENVKRIFSLGFAHRDEKKKFHQHQFVSRVNRHEGDLVSIEARIARLTVKIRTQIVFCLNFRKDKVARCRLNENIQRRHCLLKRLQRSDFPKFLQVCDALNVRYISVREQDLVPRSVRQRTLLEAEAESQAIRKEKIENLEAKFEKEKEEFYQEKEILMEQIEADLKEMGIDGREMLNGVLDKEFKQQRWLNSKWYKFLQRFPPVQKKYATMKVQQ